VELIKNHYPEFQLIECDRNHGFAEACNRGVQISQGDWIATLNPDTEVDVDYLASLVREICINESNLGMLQPRVLFMDRPDRYNSTGIGLTSVACGFDCDFDVPVRESDKSGEIFCVTAGAALYRRSMLEGVRLGTGFFDWTFFMYCEDLDLGWRCRLAGWSAVYVPTSTVYHRYQGSVRVKGEKFAELQCRKNRLRALLKNGSLLLITNSLGQTIKDLLFSLRYKGLRAFCDFYSSIRDGLRQRREVTAITQVNRRELESRWITGTSNDAS
jgi:GT2 family glycosyltransferase